MDLRLKIRPAKPADAAAVAAIYNDAVAKTTATFDTESQSTAAQRRIIREHGRVYPFLVAEAAGRVVGWASVSRWSERCAYRETVENSVYVDEAARGRGAGQTLLAALFKEARRRGYHTVLARIAEGNAASARLHRKAGFFRVGLMREVGFKFGKRLDVEILQKFLGRSVK